MTAPPRIIDRPIPSFNRDGTVKDLACPDPQAVCFFEMAGTLSRIARFNGVPSGIPYSVAQHCVMGAEAIRREGGSRHEAAFFLLHDGHEWALGDMTRPMQDLLSGLLASLAVRAAIDTAKDAWDRAIYTAARLPVPACWSPRERKTVKAMDDRMCAAEAIALFGERAATQFPTYSPARDVPRTVGAIKPWPAMIAEERFVYTLGEFIGADVIGQQAEAAASRRTYR